MSLNYLDLTDSVNLNLVFEKNEVVSKTIQCFNSDGSAFDFSIYSASTLCVRISPDSSILLTLSPTLQTGAFKVSFTNSLSVGEYTYSMTLKYNSSGIVRQFLRGKISIVDESYGDIPNTVTNVTVKTPVAFTGATTYLTKGIFNTYTGTTAPATYASKLLFNTYTGTTAPSTYQLRSAFNSYTGSTLPNQIYSGASTPFIYDNQATVQNAFAYKSNVDIKGQGQITLTNGSGNITGVGTNFLNATTGRGLSYWFSLWVKDSSSKWYNIYLATIPSNTGATISKVLSRNLIRLGGYINDGGNAYGGSQVYPTLPSTFTGTTGTYDYWITRNWSDGLFSTAMGNNAYADNFSFAWGGQAVAVGQTSLALGRQVYALGSNTIALGTASQALVVGGTAIGYRAITAHQYATALGVSVAATNAGAVAIGFGSDVAGSASDKLVLASGINAINVSCNDSNQIVGHGAQAQGSGVLGGMNGNVPSNSTYSVTVGGYGIKATSGVSYTVFLPKVRIGYGTSGALTSGSTSNDVIVRGAAGELMVRDALGIGLGTQTYTGKKTFVASTSGSAALNIPSGATVSSPGNGDLWIDGTGAIKIRIGGVTKTITVS